MINKLVAFSCVVLLAHAGKSPNGEKYLNSLTAEELAALPEYLLEDAQLDVPGLISKYGYNAETHTVTTEDGFILTLHRMAGKKGESVAGRTPVLLMHGLMGASSNWVVAQGPGAGFGYTLAEAGYDVWMGNARGTFYSRNHTTLDPNSRTFWRFSWHQIGYYDLPAKIDYILKKTGSEKLHYVGHSQGTTSFFVMTSTRPEWNEKIISMNAFAPVAYMTHMESPLVRTLGKYANSIQYLVTLIGRNEFVPNSRLLAQFSHEYCQEGGKYLDLCIAVLFGSTADLDHVNLDMIPLYLSHNPNGASSRQFVHYAQEHYSGMFRNYDFGFMGNKLIYGRYTPPRYNTKRITAPVALHYSLNDGAVHPIDVAKLFGELKNPIGMFQIERDTFTHIDFIWGTDAPTQLYERTLGIIREYDAKLAQERRV